MQNHYGLRAILVMALLALGCRMGLAQIGPRYVLELEAGKPAAVTDQGQVQLLRKGLALIRFQGLSMLTVAADAAEFSRDAVPGWPDADLVLVTPPGQGRYAGLAPLAALPSVPVIIVERANEPASAGASASGSARAAPQLYPMQAFDALHLRKGKTRLRVTALPGAAGTAGVAGFLFDIGNSRASYRLYISCDALAADEIHGLPQRLPGADLALLPDPRAPQLLELRRSGRPGTAKLAAVGGAAYTFTPLKRP